MSAKRPKAPIRAETGFEFGARILGMSVDAFVKLYQSTIEILKTGIITGKTNAPLGLIHTLEYADFLHGGAYASPVNKIPFFMVNPSLSPYYAGELRNLPNPNSIGGYLALFFAGTNAEQNAIEVLMDGNVPHVLPKLLSDQAYAQIKILYSQAATTDLFKTASTGVKTLVEGFTGGEGFGFLQKGTPEKTSQREARLQQRLDAALALVGDLSPD